MDERVIDDIRKALAENRARRKKAAAAFDKEVAPLFWKWDRKPPGQIVDSAYLYLRSCDADQGMRPLPCPVFWLSPDIRITPLANTGQPTRELIAGHAYRLTATLRNRGDLAVPAAKVEFFLTNPTLGFDTRVATRLGTTVTRIEAMGAVETSIDHIVPPGLSGHRCLFARAFSFQPLDLPISDYALDPVIDRHIAQQNLTIIAGGSTMVMDVIHQPNADDMIRILPMSAADLRALRIELPQGLRPVAPRMALEVANRIRPKLLPATAKGVEIVLEPTREGLLMSSRSPKSMSTGQQAELMKSLIAIRQAVADGRAHPAEAQPLEQHYRDMTAGQLHSQLVLDLPDAGLKPDQMAPLQIQRVSRATGLPSGGIALMLTGHWRG